ncbi:hypothetical protein COEREDRAFT_89918 [Coemansia reversa NRRL 1564]|uniref:Uncharacterized protein n=1 Tax=Coemansia reversa (strain ATCC 12441 / NRRL 1564) TaxID=763665 RepID=A0A2G5B1V4_COERN|nr:hypothetical protein COEREDRAFT_89918 [Coemansia reversa NRRL 1564]|eukprot:PIA12984.1 hypothetical protein COEREDRAFT_89918 [Coemansia reversa NRRL 1564]
MSIEDCSSRAIILFLPNDKKENAVAVRYLNCSLTEDKALKLVYDNPDIFNSSGYVLVKSSVDTFSFPIENSNDDTCNSESEPTTLKHMLYIVAGMKHPIEQSILGDGTINEMITIAHGRLPKESEKITDEAFTVSQSKFKELWLLYPEHVRESIISDSKISDS